VTWTSFSVRPSAGHADLVSAALFAAGSQGVLEDGAALVTQFPADTDLSAVRRHVLDADPDATIEVAPVPDVDWSAEWKSRIGAHELGGLVVTPPWLADAFDPARTIVITPGMAFGTGEHATTRGVVRLMQGVLKPGAVVADLGAGSAVLAIAAARLGAARVAAIELDPDATPDAEANVALNGVSGQVTVIEGDAALLLPLVAPVDVVLANIISSVLTALLPSIAAALAPGGCAILSGILQEERPQMLAALADGGWRVQAEDAEEVWWSVRVARA
jgi:ribosomal protein L11 methyltransferase